LISIRKEIEAIETGEQPKEGNVLKMAPHTQKDLIIGTWQRSYTREQAAYPLPYLREKKFWPSVTRLDDGMCIPFQQGLGFLANHTYPAYGDTNLFCTCAPVQDDGTTSVP
jgi:glycine dehydrogenase